MPKICRITGKRVTTGNRVSHANRKTRRRFQVNIQKKRFWLESEKRFVTLRLSTKAIKIIDKKGLEVVLRESGLL